MDLHWLMYISNQFVALKQKIRMIWFGCSEGQENRWLMSVCDVENSLLLILEHSSYTSYFPNKESSWNTNSGSHLPYSRIRKNN